MYDLKSLEFVGTSLVTRYVCIIRGKIKCAKWWFDTCIHSDRCIHSPIELTHQSSHILSCYLFWVVEVRTFKFSSCSKFQLYNTVLPTRVTLFCIRPPDLIHLIGESLCLLPTCFEGCFCWVHIYRLTVTSFSLGALKALFLCVLVCVVSDEKSPISLLFVR